MKRRRRPGSTDERLRDVVRAVSPAEGSGEEHNRPPIPTPQEEVPADGNHEEDEHRRWTRAT
jgi:hypothetical protein